MKSILAIAACLLICQGSQAQEYKSNRPAPEKRCFSSEAVERTIAELSSKLANPKLAWMFSNCFPTPSTPPSNTTSRRGIPSSSPATSTLCG